MTRSRAGRVIVENLREGTDLYREIVRIARENGINSGLVTGTGSVQRALITSFDQKTMTFNQVEVHGPMEIISMYGDLLGGERESIPMIHVVLADEDGNGSGGRLLPDGTPVLWCRLEIEALETDTDQNSQ